MSTEQEITQLEQALQKLVGETCDGIKYTASERLPLDNPAYHRPFYPLDDGSYMPLVSLQFGVYREVFKTVIVENPLIYSLGIFGLWRIVKVEAQICSYIGALNNDGLLLEHLNKLKNRVVQQVSMNHDNLNLVIEFDKNFRLEIVQAQGLLSGFQFSYTRGGIWQVINGEIGSKWCIAV